MLLPSCREAPGLAWGGGCLFHSVLKGSETFPSCSTCDQRRKNSHIPRLGVCFCPCEERSRKKPMFCHLLVNISTLWLLVMAMKNEKFLHPTSSCIHPTNPCILNPTTFRVPRAWICLSLSSWGLYLMWGGQTQLRGCCGTPSLTVPSTCCAPPGTNQLPGSHFQQLLGKHSRGFAAPNLCWTPGHSPEFPILLLTPHLQLQQSTGSSWMKEEEFLAVKADSGFGKRKSGECERGFVSCS